MNTEKSLNLTSNEKTLLRTILHLSSTKDYSWVSSNRVAKSFGRAINGVASSLSRKGLIVTTRSQGISMIRLTSYGLGVVRPQRKENEYRNVLALANKEGLKVGLLVDSEEFGFYCAAISGGNLNDQKVEIDIWLGEGIRPIVSTELGRIFADLFSVDARDEEDCDSATREVLRHSVQNRTAA